MALKIRLRQQGRTNRPFYRLVVADVNSPRDGRFVEILGWYNPFETEAEKHISVSSERVQHWIDQGAEISDKAEALIARAAPEIVEKRREQQIARREKLRQKKKARKAKKAAA